MKKNLLSILFWGAVWGICEASIGYVLHLAATAVPGLSGALMFPIGFFCMYQARKATGKAAAPVYIAGIAAAIKLVDFLLPGFVAIRVINPALSILMEGLAVAAVYALLRAPGKVADLARVLAMSVLWRVMFAGYLFVLSLYGLPATLVTSGAATLLSFLLLQSLYNGVIMFAGLWIAPKLPAHKPWKVGPVIAVAAFAAAIGLQVFL